MIKISSFWKLILLMTLAGILYGCPLTVNLNVSTEKPLAVTVIIDKPVELKLAADIGVSKLPPIRAHANIDVSKLPPVRMGLAPKQPPKEEKTKAP